MGLSVILYSSKFPRFTPVQTWECASRCSLCTRSVQFFIPTSRFSTRVLAISTHQSAARSEFSALPANCMDGEEHTPDAQQQNNPAPDVARAVQFPPLDHQLGARVEHLTLQHDGSLLQSISDALVLPQPLVKELMRFGAIYYCPVVPLPNERIRMLMSKEALSSIERCRQQAISIAGKNPAHQTPQRVFEDREVRASSYARVHLHPKRFPAAHRVDWPTRIIRDTPEFVVVNKPAGVQVPPTVDNVLESVIACVAQVVGSPRESLLPLHRLDAGTEGVVVLGKNPVFANHFVKMLPAKGGVLKKSYRCLTRAAPPLGRLVHYVKLGHCSPGEPPHTLVLGGEEGAEGAGPSTSGTGGQPDGMRCELVVEKVEEVELTGRAAAEWGSSAWEVTIELITGRTHQIRAQMMAVGCPLLGDSLYTSLLAKRKADQISKDDAQQQAGECRQQSSGPEASAGASTPTASGPSWSKEAQDDPLRPLALQAFRLAVHDPDERLGAGPQVFDAGVPWWRGH